MNDINHQSRITNHVGYEIRENDMIESKTTFPSVGAASATIATMVLAASLLLMPRLAVADDECGVQMGTTPVECSASSYNSGVTYDAVGDLVIDFNNDATSTIGGTGITLTGDGVEDITFDSNDPTTTIRSQSGMDGNLLGVTTVDGNILITTSVVDADTNNAENVDRAIFAQSTGTGSIDITATGLVDAESNTNPASAVGIEGITNSGDLTITVSGPLRGNAAAIAATTGTGSLTVNIIGVESGFGTSVDGDMRIDTGNSAVINIGSERNFRGDTYAAGTGSLTVNNDGTIRGGFDFAELSGGFTVNNNAGATWQLNQSVDLGRPGVINNAGTIVFDAQFFAQGNTLLSAPGTAFVGSGDSLLAKMDVFLDGRGNTVCVSAPDCFDLSGGSTAGQSRVLVRASFTTLVEGPLTTVTSANPGLVLIDVSGGTSAADHFVLDPGSVLIQDDGAGTTTTAAYATDPVYGAVLDTSVLGMGGIFDYALLYNPDTQQHLLASVPQPEAIAYASFIRQMSSIWHTTTDVIVGRQAALRDGATGRLWARYVNDSTDYDAAPSFTSQGNTFVYDQQYSLDTQSLIIGLDLISGDDRVFGVHGGLIESDSKFDGTGISDENKGVTAGFYGAWWHDNGLSLDGAINLTSLTIDHSLSSDTLESGDSDARSLGIRIEGSWRVPLMEETLYVQPLATAAYVLADFDDVDLRDNEISFEDTNSSRAGLGARLGGAVNLNNDMISRVGYWLTGRAWEEYADDGEARFATRDGGYLAIADDRSGSFEEVELGVNLTNREGNLDVHLSGGIQSGDEIDSSSRVSIGARLNW